MLGNHVATTSAQSEYRARAAKLMIAAAATLGTAAVCSAAEQTTSSDELTEIIVTATRQATTVQTTPISIEAFTGAEIASRGIVDLDSLVNSVPAIAVRNTGGPGEMEFEVRGLNSQGGNSSMVGYVFRRDTAVDRHGRPARQEHDRTGPL